MTPTTQRAVSLLHQPMSDITDVELQAAAHEVAGTDQRGYETVLGELRHLSITGRPLQPVAYSAAELQSRRFAERRWAIESLIPEGLTLLGGKPKTGKSWFALGLAVAISSGDVAIGSFPVEQGPVFYAALEDSPRRLKERLHQILGVREWSSELQFINQWSRLDEGGLEDLASELDRKPETRLVILDTLAKVRPGDTSRRLYDADYQALGPLQSLAADRGVAILLIHHLRKEEATDWIDALSGTSGLTGVADSVLGLFRDRGRADAVLKGTGRDMDEFEIALRFDNGNWSHLGEASDYRVSEERGEIIALFRELGEPTTPAEVAEALDRTPGSVRKLMATMSKQGDLHALGDGYYELPDTGNSAHTGRAPVTGVSTVTTVEPSPDGDGP